VSGWLCVNACERGAVCGWLRGWPCVDIGLNGGMCEEMAERMAMWIVCEDVAVWLCEDGRVALSMAL
jgi:hypothetical protein